MKNIGNNALNNDRMDNHIVATGLGDNISTNYDMQKLMNIVGRNSDITGQIGLNVQNINKQMGIMSVQMNSITDDMSTVKGEIEMLKLNEEITATQQEVITRSARKRVYNVLHNDDFEIEKYFRTFIGRCYSNAKRYAGLGSTISRTRKGDFQRVIDYIEAWVPINGSAELKAEVDRKALEKRRAKELGYE